MMQYFEHLYLIQRENGSTKTAVDCLSILFYS